MGDGLEQLMKTWVPILGAGLSIGLGTVPMQEVLRCRRNKSLGKVRRAPFECLCSSLRIVDVFLARSLPQLALLHPACLVTMRLRMSKVNADVFPLLFGNNIGWVIYASLNHNPYMFVSCFPNVMLV
jgi:hypothetical protein